MNTLPSLRDWMPIAVTWTSSGPVVEWCDFAGTSLTEPFFDHTVTWLLRHPARNLIRPLTDIETVARLAGAASGTPGGLIFHLSRCGSTLLSQMLAATTAQVVLSEPSPLDQLLTLRRTVPGIPDSTWSAWLRALVQVMGRARGPGPSRWFWKCDARHVLDLPFLTAALPGVPWLFLYRDPLEVLVAHRGQPAPLMVPGAWVPGMEALYSPPDTPPEEHIARVLAACCRAALTISPAGLFMDYDDLPHTAWLRLQSHFNLQLTPEESARSLAVAARDAKNPAQPWQSDTGRRRAAATPEDHAAIARHFADLLPALHAARSAGS
jgi:hypothetical protein